MKTDNSKLITNTFSRYPYEIVTYEELNSSCVHNPVYSCDQKVNRYIEDNLADYVFDNITSYLLRKNPTSLQDLLYIFDECLCNFRMGIEYESEYKLKLEDGDNNYLLGKFIIDILVKTNTYPTGALHTFNFYLYNDYSYEIVKHFEKLLV